MSTYDPFSPPPQTDNGGLIAANIIGAIVGLGILFLIAYCCIQMIKRSITTGVQDGITNATIVSTLPSGQDWHQVDAATMERFLHDIAREKPIRFTAQEIQSFTENYSTRLGSGGFGVVYQGKFPNGIKVAVKVLNRSSDKRVIEAQFMAEVGSIGRTYHINLVRLYGFCFDQIMSALVYEYMENGSLDNILFGTEAKQIEWEKLQEIAIGTAKGLAYLHEECQQRIIHYDIKPGNVLLDLNFFPKVADFGLAKLCNRDNTHVSYTGYRGTPGYSAPEFLMHNYPITHKCDVYSFGMLLFEIVRRRRNTDSSNQSDSLDWFPKRVWEEYGKDGLKDLTMEIGIEDEDREKAERMFVVALWCVQDSPDSRPQMSRVVKMLEGNEVEIMPPPNPFRYLYSLSARDVASIGSDNSITESRTDHSSWYKDSTPIMSKYEIQIATSS